MSCFITAYGLISALGEGVDASAEALLAWQAKGSTPLTRHNQALLDGRLTPVGRVEGELPAIPAALAPYASRNNQLLLAALAQIRHALGEALATFGPARVGLVLGTSTAGIGEAELAVAAARRGEAVPLVFDYRQQELGSPSEFLARHLGLEGPAYTLSTACSSSARAFISGQRMLAAGLVDAVLVGGADSLCGLTLNGFDSLESLSGTLCQPFDNGRQGINIGEGAALFLLSRQPAPLALLGVGESSDAWHISAPHPDGVGAEAAMGMALAQAGLTPEQVGYINLHGTATRLNDAMESQAVYRLFGDRVPCSSTKPLTGHVLGAAGAIEAALACLLLERALPLPPQRVMTGDPALAPIRLVSGTTPLATPRILSNSFAFGGNNVSLLFGKSAS
ncbi:MAG: beta-ketoacyl-[acyl-carrier-protein] synthase family protein [Aeromonas sp.]|jgi:3-oxoacyl-[acyl-carrier-protein] synthase-1|uniref:beta-ketoacyl-[acyl-carrier-protein] synthase family protein n=1 Tax=Aeromonas TaxID=642 RepID=UPI000DCFAA79|nr:MULTISPECIES: beta-ketoacyl-[acyl-carrier-protein] synthase family protein [Aeromonas]MBP6166902.1 beta-ketoacyl-[acyl-carrier-protein] synthase family protein [Aeromonas sp.]WED82230.1 beta-ketoacyl-[acyl-carrier-protein] synthase family protein [Aeromonas media]